MAQRCQFRALSTQVASKADVFQRLPDACSDEPDMEYARVDATIVSEHT
jgi:hypothetical protein